MAALGGGMAFQGGITARVGEPAEVLAARTVWLPCPSRPVVAVGQRVSAGEPLSDPDDPAHPIQAAPAAPVTGTVESIVPYTVGKHRWHAVTLRAAADESPTTLALTPPDPLDRKTLGQLRRLGPWAQAELGDDLIAQIRQVQDQHVEAVICVGLDAFAPYPVRSSLLESFPDEVAAGTRFIGELVGAGRIELLVRHDLDELRRLKRSCRRSKVRCKPVDNVYPDSHPTLVVYAHGGGRRSRRMLPRGESPAARGLVLVSPWHALRIGRWLNNEKLDMARPYFVGWAQPRMPMRVQWAFPGQPLAQLAEALGGTSSDLAGRAVLGDPMTGRRITSPTDETGKPMAPGAPADELLVALVTEPARDAPDPCINCGWCADVCPTRLQPIRLIERGQHDAKDPRLQERLNWCIDCGLCTHVCPSQIPLAQMLRDYREAGSKNESRH